MSRLEHYAGQDEIGLRYNSHRTKREEYLVMSGDEFMERFAYFHERRSLNNFHRDRVITFEQIAE